MTTRDKSIDKEFWSIASFSKDTVIVYEEVVKDKLERECKTRDKLDWKCYLLLAASCTLIMKIDVDLYYLASIVAAILSAAYSAIPLCMRSRQQLSAVTNLPGTATPEDVLRQSSVNLVDELDGLTQRNISASHYIQTSTVFLVCSFGNFVFMALLRRFALGSDALLSIL